MKAYSKALIIDDDADLCLMLKSVVNTVIPNVQYAQTLAAGRQLFNQFRPEVIFLDNNLPDGQGLQLIEEIKRISPGVLLIFITAVNSPKEQALEYGVDLFLEKPFTYSAIFQALETGAREPETM